MIRPTALCFLLASAALAGDGQLGKPEPTPTHWVNQAMLVNVPALLAFAHPDCAQTEALLPASTRLPGRPGVGRLRQQVHTQQTCTGSPDEPAPLWRAGSFIRLTLESDLAAGFSGELQAAFLNDWPGYVVLDPDSAFKIEDQTYYRQLDLVYDGADLELTAQDLSLSFELYYASRSFAPLVVTMSTHLVVDTQTAQGPDGSVLTQVLTAAIASQQLTLDPLFPRRNLAGRQILRDRPIIVRTLR